MKGGWGGARWLLVRTQWRHTTASLLILALVVAASAGVVLGALAGARRSESAFGRFRNAVGATDVDISARGLEPLDLSLMDEIRATPGVEDAVAIAFVGASPDAFPSFFSAAFVDPGELALDAVIDGRRPDPEVATEVVINEAMRDVLDVQVGDVVPFSSLAPNQVDGLFSGERAEPGGPSIDMTVVGIGRSPEDVSDSPDPFTVLTPAFARQFEARVLMCTCVIQVRSAPGSQPAVIDALEDLLPMADVGVQEDFEGRIVDAVAIQADALRLIGAIVALAGGVMVVTVARRVGRDSALTGERLDALGWPKRRFREGMVLTMAPAVLLGAVGAGGLGYLFSALVPVGLARRAEIDPGLRPDLLVMVGGVPMVTLVGLVAIAVATRSSRPRVAPPTAGAVRSRLLLAPSLGTRAVRGPGRLGVLGAALASGAGVAAVTLTAAIDRTLETPAWFGAPADVVSDNDDADVVGAISAAAQRDPLVDAVAEVWVPTLNQLDEQVTLRSSQGVASVGLGALVTRRGLMTPTMRQGRPPADADEIVLGGAILRALGVDVGDEIVAEGFDGDVRMTVVGEVVLAGTDDTDAGALVTGEGLARIGSTIARAVLIRPAEGTTVAEVVARFAEDGLPLAKVETPSEVRNLGELGPVPGWAAGALATIGLGALVTALLVTRRASRRDQAILRALGLSRRTARWAVLWQGILTGAAGVSIGVPAGWLAGRTLHRSLADQVSVLAPPVWPATLWFAVAFTLLACIVAAVPFALAQTPARLRTD